MVPPPSCLQPHHTETSFSFAKLAELQRPQSRRFFPMNTLEELNQADVVPYRPAPRYASYQQISSSQNAFQKTVKMCGRKSYNSSESNPSTHQLIFKENVKLSQYLTTADHTTKTAQRVLSNSLFHSIQPTLKASCPFQPKHKIQLPSRHNQRHYP